MPDAPGPPGTTGLRAAAAEAADDWWRSAIVYCLDVETFADGDGDGIGDFVGATDRLDHIAGLGATCVWLMPFYPTPDLDDGYDVAGYYDVDPRLGTLGDLVEFVRAAGSRGLRVIADLVLNHTSTEHPWFREARRGPGSPLHDFYVWSDDPEPVDESELIFPGEQDSVWTRDEEAGRWYRHSFYGHQPDLNVWNPRVRTELRKVIGFWLELGLSGFRIDAVPYLIEQHGEGSPLPDDPHAWLRDLRAFVSARRGDAVLVGEVNLEPGQLRAFFGDEDGDELHMLFGFVVNQALYLALARGEAAPLERALESLPELPARGQWATFVRNHDELTLSGLSEQEREEVFAAFAPEEEMRIFGRGIRRRLPSMVDGDARRLELAYSLLFALPGTPVLLYGEEIGMGDDLSAPGRMSVRTAMQWSPARSGGFSTAERPRIPVVTGGRFGFERVNVEAQRADRGSLLHHVERLARARKEAPELGRGAWRLLDPGDPAALAHRCDWRDRAVVCVHNLADRPATARLDGHGQWRDLLGGGAVDAAAPLELGPYGYRWLRAAP